MLPTTPTRIAGWRLGIESLVWDRIPNNSDATAGFDPTGSRDRIPRVWDSIPSKSDTFSIFACHPCAGAMLIFSVSFQFLRMMPKHSDLMITAAFTSGRRLPRSIIVMWRAQARLEKLLSGSGEHHRAGHWLKFSTSNQMASVYTSRAHLLPPVQERWSDLRLPLPTQRLPCIMAPKEGTTGIEPVTIGSAIQCSTAELCTHRLGTVTGSSPRRVETMKCTVDV